MPVELELEVLNCRILKTVIERQFIAIIYELKKIFLLKVIINNACESVMKMVEEKLITHKAYWFREYGRVFYFKNNNYRLLISILENFQEMDIKFKFNSISKYIRQTYHKTSRKLNAFINCKSTKIPTYKFAIYFLEKPESVFNYVVCNNNLKMANEILNLIKSNPYCNYDVFLSFFIEYEKQNNNNNNIDNYIKQLVAHLKSNKHAPCSTKLKDAFERSKLYKKVVKGRKPEHIEKMWRSKSFCRVLIKMIISDIDFSHNAKMESLIFTMHKMEIFKKWYLNEKLVNESEILKNRSELQHILVNHRRISLQKTLPAEVIEKVYSDLDNLCEKYKTSTTLLKNKILKLINCFNSKPICINLTVDSEYSNVSCSNNVSNVSDSFECTLNSLESENISLTISKDSYDDEHLSAAIENCSIKSASSGCITIGSISPSHNAYASVVQDNMSINSMISASSRTIASTSPSHTQEANNNQSNRVKLKINKEELKHDLLLATNLIYEDEIIQKYNDALINKDYKDDIFIGVYVQVDMISEEILNEIQSFVDSISYPQFLIIKHLFINDCASISVLKNYLCQEDIFITNAILRMLIKNCYYIKYNADSRKAYISEENYPQVKKVLNLINTKYYFVILNHYFRSEDFIKEANGQYQLKTKIINLLYN